jgi:peptidoglycan/LPS O-acetylase OafA/YrhL
MVDAPKPSPRYYDLDALRAVATVLGIALHASFFVLPELVYPWPVHDTSVGDDPTYHIIFDVTHGLRTPVFYLLSGMFTVLLWERRGLHALAMQRLKRLGIPLAVGCFTIVPLTALAMALTSGRQPPYDFPFWVLPILWIFATMHLWFLWNLLLMVGMAIIMARRGVEFRNPKVWLLVIPISAVASLLMQEPVFGADSMQSLLPKPATFLFYSCFFFFGAFFYRQGVNVRRWWTVALLPAAIVFSISFLLLREYAAEAKPFTPGELPEHVWMFSTMLTAVSALLETAFAWLTCFGLMGLFRWLMSRPSFTVRYLSDASYWMYMAHLPLVIVANWIVVDWPISYHVKYIVTCASVTAVLLITYQLFVRYTFIGTAMNGPRTRRQRATGSVAPGSA